MTLLGSIAVNRAYYHCRVCRAGACPRDADLGLSRSDLSRGAAEVVSMAGVLSGFGEAATKTLPKLCGLRVSESTVQRTTERAGSAVGERLAAGETFGPAVDWAWSRDAEGKTYAVVSADSTGVGMQGPKGAEAEGRMAAVGMVYNPGVAGAVRYVAGLEGGLAALGESLRRQAFQVGMDQAERWIAISDGGSGIEDFLRSHFPRVEAVILDFYHVSEYLNDWAKARHASDPAAAQALAGDWCHRLKHEGGAVVLEGLRNLDRRGWSAAARTSFEKLRTYFENQVHRMDYPAYRAKGWAIGSGPVEAACKLVVGQRLKGTGMRWGEDGADGVCHLRALFRSEKGQWDSCWATLAV